MSFFDQYFSLDKRKAKDKTPQLLDELYKVPKRDKGNSVPHFRVFAPNYVHQADLLSLPEDDGYKYLLVVVDVNSRITDAEPLKGKTAQQTLDAFKKIYSRKILKIPKRLEVDQGSEFKSTVKKWFDDQQIPVRLGKTARHRQQAIVERRNQIIGTAIAKRQAAEEILTGEPSKQWVDDLPSLIKAMNARTKKQKIKINVSSDPVCDGDSCNLLDIGTKVRAVLEQPTDIATGKRLHGRFRSGDIRFDPRIRVIREVLVKPGFPPMYLLDGDTGRHKVDTNAYTKNQLQVVKKNEQGPDSQLIRNPEKRNKYIVNEILERKKINGKIYMKVSWKGYPLSQATWEARSTLMEDIPDEVKAFEKKR